MAEISGTGVSTAPRAVDWAMIGLLGIVWGATFLVIEIALRGISPFWLASARVGFAAILMGSVWLARGAPLFYTKPSRADILRLAGTSVLSTACPFMLLSWGQQYVTSGFAGVSMAAVGLMVLPLAHLFLPDEEMTLRKFIGFAVGFVGVVVLIGASALESSGIEGEFWGRLACLGAAFCYANSGILMRKLPGIDTIGLAAMTFLLGGITVIAVAFSVEGPPPLPGGQTLLALAVLGLVPTAGANLLRIFVIRHAGPSFMSLTSYQVPIWSVVFGALILSEPLPPTLLISLALILTGVAVSQWGHLRRLFTRIFG